MIKSKHFYILFAIVLALFFGQVFAAEGGGGFLDETPPWFVKVKSSEKPLPGNRVQELDVFAGSGIWISDRLVLTCWHNWRDTWNNQRKFAHTLEDHTGHVYEGFRIVSIDRGADLMLVEVKGEVQPHGYGVVSSDSQQPDDVTCYGLDSDGERFRWSNGDLLKHEDGSYIRRLDNSRRRKIGHVTDAVVVPGMSGGPAINESGEIVGINVGHSNGRTQMISLSVIQKFLTKVKVPGM